jgi:hypothetical protein
MAEEATTTPAENGEAPVTEAAAPQQEAPAGPPEGYIEEKRYSDLRSNHDRINSLIDRARQGDEQAAEELGFQLHVDEEIPDPEDPELADDPRIAAHDDWIRQQEQAEEFRQFNAHLDSLAGDMQLDDDDRLLLLSKSTAAGFTPEATEKAFEAFKARREAQDKAAFDRYVKSKKAPHVSQVGTGATDEVLPLDASRKDRVAWMTERFQLGQES